MRRSLRVSVLDREGGRGLDVPATRRPERVDARGAQLAAAVGGLDLFPALVGSAKPVLVGEPGGQSSAHVVLPAVPAALILAPEIRGVRAYECREVRGDVGHRAVVVAPDLDG